MSTCEFCRALLDDLEAPANMVWCQRGTPSLGPLLTPQQMSSQQVHDFARPRYSSARSLDSMEAVDEEWTTKARGGSSVSSSSCSHSRHSENEAWIAKARGGASISSDARISEVDFSENFKQGNASKSHLGTRWADRAYSTDSRPSSSSAHSSFQFPERRNAQGKLVGAEGTALMPKWPPTVVRHTYEINSRPAHLLSNHSKPRKCLHPQHRYEHRHVFTVTATNW